MFGTGAAFIALTLLAFDPNLLAHGALITTDVGLACFMFLSVYMFYRFLKSPSALRLIMAGACGRACTGGQTHRSSSPPDSFLTHPLRDLPLLQDESRKDRSPCTQAFRFVGAHHPHRLGGPMVLLQISLRRATKRSANESALSSSMSKG